MINIKRIDKETNDYMKNLELMKIDEKLREI
jgi:hypothetical protein